MNMISKFKSIGRAGAVVWLLSCIFFLIYNTYFGWNLQPINENEVFCDTLFERCMSFGLILYIYPFVRAYSKLIWSKNV
jgi:hypothetical protein